jgi:MoxR-like ATPase
MDDVAVEVLSMAADSDSSLPGGERPEDSDAPSDLQGPPPSGPLTHGVKRGGEAPEPQYQYQKIFNPIPSGRTRTRRGNGSAERSGDQTAGYEYVFTEEIILAVNVALVAERPLLVSGPPGSGKTSLAQSVADWTGWDYYQETITSRTQARSLLWEFDAVRRLSDAQVAAVSAEARKRLLEAANYVRPGVLWRAFDPEGAQEQQQRSSPERAGKATSGNKAQHGGFTERAVVLLDEIDKADPDVPSDLLRPLGAYTFEVDDMGQRSVRVTGGRQPPVIIITTNGERDLPKPFLRRCVILKLKQPLPAQLVRIAGRRFADTYGHGNAALYQAIADATVALAKDAERANVPGPGTAEFLDAVGTCLRLRVHPDDKDLTWLAIKGATLEKARTQ